MCEKFKMVILEFGFICLWMWWFKLVVVLKFSGLLKLKIDILFLRDFNSLLFLGLFNDLGIFLSFLICSCVICLM